jgi:chloramphenicol-sensitive protein RarD
VLAVLGLNGGIALSTVDFKTDILIVLAGAATLIPLLLFAEGAVRIPLIRVGFLQYIAPTLMLLAGVVLGEKMNVSQIVCFCFIWAGLAVYTITNYRNRRGMDERTNHIGPATEKGQS